jgi:hypothetical protein
LVCPLLQVITISEFEAVLAHEFGHYHGGDTRLGPWIYKTRLAIGQTIANLASSSHRGAQVLKLPFVWYGNLFLRITLAISRAQELAADRLAADVVGAEALEHGLSAIHRAAPVAAYYMNSEVLPVVRSGFAPPLVEGFEYLLHSDSTIKAMDDNLRTELASAPKNVYDSHPPLAQRLNALQGLPRRGTSDTLPALSLMDDLPNLESKLVSSWLPSSERLQPILWHDTGFSVFLPGWRKVVEQSSQALEGITLEHLHYVASKLDPFARKLNLWNSGIPWSAVQQYASNVLGAALACALHAAGWAVEAAPGQLWLSQGENRINPFDTVSRMRSGELTESEWNGME